ncbi:hypothetical protein L6Q96_11845 [Candidatus Binatia bacterium]|nr:hypothetical protein [Candidatus Binatia bacterium]
MSPLAKRRRAGWGLLPIAILGAVAACGRKGAPRPPQDVVPASITDLTATQTPTGIELAWSRPTTFADGKRLQELAGFAVDRWTEVGADAPPGRLAELPVTDRERFRKIKRFVYLDTTTIVGISYRYRVVSYTDDGYVSGPSNLVAITRHAGGQGPDASLPPPQR